MRWNLLPDPDQEIVNNLASSLSVNPILSKLLVQRGITSFNEAKSFFRPNLEELHDPFLMKGMQNAVDRILEAIENGEKILVYGDYDVDGTTSVALMSSYLLSKTELVATYIPDRYAEGYGISYKGIDFAHDNDFSLIVALDCGIKAVEKVAYAKEKGVDFVICDHHTPGETVPDAVAVLDPKQKDCNYPYKELCGCGVGFKLIQALGGYFNEMTIHLLPYLDLVAVAISADIVPITGENRILAYHGVKVLNENPRPGLKAFIRNFDIKQFTVTDIVFKIAPRINAAGRMKHAQYAVQLLLENDFSTAIQYAEDIDQYNLDRREVEKTITEEALQQVIELEEEKRFTSVVFSEDWHKGVIGIVASRLIETYYRPTLVFTKSGDNYVASARSVSGYSVYDALCACDDLIEQFGGHKYAAGLTIKAENYEVFKAKFEEVVKNSIPKELLTPEIKIDAKVNLEALTPKFYRIIKQLAPFGPGNMSPNFWIEAVKDSGYGKCVGEDKTHLKIRLKKDSNQLDAIGFSLGQHIDLVQRGVFDVVGKLDENTWQGNTSLQLMLRDLKETI